MKLYKHASENGTALIMSMILMVIVMGLVTGITILIQDSAQRSEVQLDYENALVTSDLGVSRAIMEIRSVEVDTSGDEYLGFVGAAPDVTGGDTRTIQGTANGTTYTTQVQSAYFAHHTDNPNPSDNNDFLLSITEANREESGKDIFDYYLLTSASAPVGQHELGRGVQVLMKIEKQSLEGQLLGQVPTPLYIETDPSVDMKGKMGLSGYDHNMESTSGDANAKTNNNKKTDEFQTGGAGAEDDYKRTDEDARPVNAFGYGGASTDAEDADSDEDGYPDEFENINMQGTSDQVYTEKDGETVDGYDACEFTQIDLDAFAQSIIKNAPDLVTYDSFGSAGNPKYLGAKDDFQVTYVKDGGTLAGHSEGAGILIIDGDLHISGQMTFNGIIIVLGEIDVTGGGNWDTHVFGSAMAKTIGKMTGNADIWWCSEAVEQAIGNVVGENKGFTLASYPLVWRTLDKAALQAMKFPGYTE